MLTSRLAALCLTLISTALFAAELPKPMVAGLKNPESVCLGPGGAIYITEIGEFGKDGDGQVSVVKDGKATAFVTGLDDPKGIIASPEALFVADKTKVLKIDLAGKVSVVAPAEKFPSPPLFLNDIAISPDFNSLFVSDSGDLKGAKGAVYRIEVKSGKIELVVDSTLLPGLNTPNGLALDGASFLLLADFGSGSLYRIKLSDKSHQKIAEGFDGGDGLTWDKFGRLFVTSWKQGKVWGFPRPGQKATELPYKFEQAPDSCLDASGKSVLVPDMKAGTLTAIPTTIAGWEVDDAPLAIKSEAAFSSLQWTGWSPRDESGRVKALRPILLTHAGDGTRQIYVPTQQGVIHRFANDESAQKTTVFLDISDRVRYSDKQNEEGFLGLAFHPKFKENGEFFVFYTDVKAKMANVVSRFRTKKTDPTVGDPVSEEELIRFEKPFWNHDGGTIAFGPDGYLYITHGDGGAGGDPHENGQKLSTLLGKVLRIDINRKENGKNYAIPSDNPFVTNKDAAPEIWSYGLRNIWRMAFDRQTGKLWAGEVGQNLYEEINIIKAGGNYGWSLRESLHPFGPKGVDVRDDLIEPIWEYHHDIGKSITGGLVYRGKKLPELNGAYLYADYVTARVWALWYDEAKGRVVANRPIKGPTLPIVSFGEDAEGELYLLTVTESGRGIHRLVKDAN
jgi:glucose/arabinose dehydrogenase